MTEEQTAAQVGQYDQALAAAEAEIDRLVGIVLAKTADVGEQVSGLGTAELAGLLTAALVRLARGDHGTAVAAQPGAEIDRLVGIVLVRAADVGERRAAADVCALVSEMGKGGLADLLAAALVRLARGDHGTALAAQPGQAQ
jgi:hypothetical protein